MESHLPRTQEESDLSGNPAELNSGVEGNSEGPSMLKRMKAKAKKIRNTLTGHGHDHDHDRDHSHSQSHDEEEEDEEEEMVEDLSSTIHAPDIRVHPSNVQIKTIDPAGRGSEEAEGITPVLESFNKMGISEEKPKPEQGNGAGLKSLNTRSHNQFDPEPVPSESSDYLSKGYNAANPLDMSSSESSGSFPKSYNATNPGDTPEDVFDPASQSSTYTEKITSASSAASSAIAGTAQSAKNAVASKIGQMRDPGEDIKPGEGSKSGSVTGTAKGGSRKEYLVEKLKPGEEDKALSSMITEKPNGEKMEEVSDAVRKREPEGKVTESEEVAKRLGTGEEGSEVENVGSGRGVVSMLSGAIGSWFGGAQSTPGTNLADDNEGDMGKKNTDAQGVTAKRRLRE